MQMNEFAKSIKAAAKDNPVLTILRISSKDRASGCVLRFRIGSSY